MFQTIDLIQDFIIFIMDANAQVNNERINLTLNAWKTKLLDLTKRNRALNFKPQKVSTVTIVDEQASEIFRLLCILNKSLKFKAKPETQTKQNLAENDSS